MKVLNITISDSGGAGRAALDLNSRMRDELNLNSKLVVLNKRSKNIHVKQLSRLVRWKRRARRLLINRPESNRDYQFLAFDEAVSNVFAEEILTCYGETPDIINLYWVTGLLNSLQIRRLHELTNATINWFLTDMAPFTGGCHFSLGCKGFEIGCVGCPAIQEQSDVALASNNIALKLKNLESVPMKIIVGTSELENSVKHSSVFSHKEIRRIGYFVDDTLFQNGSKSDARNLVSACQGISFHKEKKVVLIGATHMSQRRKGMTELVQALQMIEIEAPEIAAHMHVLFCGKSPPQFQNEKLQMSAIGNISLSQLANLYRASDIFISPSIDDIGPFMLLEAMLSERTVVTFPVGLAPDVISNGSSGYLCKQVSARELAFGIRETCSWTGEKLGRVGQHARKSAMDYYGWQNNRRKLEQLFLEP